MALNVTSLSQEIHMLSAIRMGLIGLGVGATLFAFGCQSNGAKAESSASLAAQAVTCDTCKVTYVKMPIEAKGRVVGYSTRKEMECPMCKDAVTNFFQTGKLEHTCTACGGNMSICEAH
jgi:hypothetical protein